MQSNSPEPERRRRFDRVVVVFYPDLYRYAAWLSRDSGIAEVVVQESLLRAWKSLDGLKEDGAAKQWLLTIVRRENARYFERKRLDAVDIDNLTPAQALMIAESGDSDLDDVRQAIYRLDESYREPLVLQVLMGHSCNEIAELMGIAQGAVLTRLHRARNKLRQALNDGSGCLEAARESDEV